MLSSSSSKSPSAHVGMTGPPPPKGDGSGPGPEAAPDRRPPPADRPRNDSAAESRGVGAPPPPDDPKAKPPPPPDEAGGRALRVSRSTSRWASRSSSSFDGPPNLPNLSFIEPPRAGEERPSILRPPAGTVHSARRGGGGGEDRTPDAQLKRLPVYH